MGIVAYIPWPEGNSSITKSGFYKGESAMRGKIFAFAATLAALIVSATIAAAGDTSVRGYYRSNGTYVQPHMRSAPDGNPNNNWSTKGNVNPYMGQPGTKEPYNQGYGSSGGSSFGNQSPAYRPFGTYGSQPGQPLLNDGD